MVEKGGKQCRNLLVSTLVKSTLARRSILHQKREHVTNYMYQPSDK
jgi:hypothetical protein